MPPFEGEGPPLDVGAAADLPEPAVVGGHILEEAAAEAQRLQEGTDLPLQAAFAPHYGAKGLGDAQVHGQDDHGDLWDDTRGAQRCRD